MRVGPGNRLYGAFDGCWQNGRMDERLSGVVEGVTFHNAGSGFAAPRVQVPGLRTRQKGGVKYLTSGLIIGGRA
jgi:hypothetical protein